MGRNVILNCESLSLEEMESVLNNNCYSSNNIYYKINSNLLYNKIIEKIKSLDSKVYFNLKKDNNSLYDIMKILISNRVDVIEVDVFDGYDYLTKVISCFNKVYEDYNYEYQKYKDVCSYPAEAYKYYLAKIINHKPLLLGNLSNNLDLNSLPLIHVISLAKLCQNEGFNGVICNLSNIEIIKQTCGNDFVTISTNLECPSEYIMEKISNSTLNLKHN